VIKEMDLKLADGRTLHCYDSGDAGGLTVFWHHGSPNTGTPPEPLFPAAAERGIRWVSYDRPGYMSSTARPGRAARCPDAELWLRPDDGHVSVLGSCGVAALDWLVAHA
jgi:pimeloyl-ACP methyl ester carboxylesterase